MIEAKRHPERLAQLGRDIVEQSDTLQELHTPSKLWTDIGALLTEEFVKAYAYSGTGSHRPEPLRELVDKLCRQLNDDNKEV